MSQVRYFFALREDIMPGLVSFEHSANVRFVLVEMRSNPDFQVYNNLSEYPHLGTEKAEATVLSARFLIVPKSVNLGIEIFTRSNGETRFHIHQGNNPDSIYITPGGIHRSGYLIAGEIENCSVTLESRRIFRLICKCLLKDFTYENFYYVGPNAAALRREGIKFTQNIGRKRSFDAPAT